MRIGIDLGGTKIEAILLDDANRERFRKRVETPRGDYEATLGAVAALVREIESAFALKRAPVGIGTPGALSPKTGRIRNCNSTWLIDRPLDRDLERLLDRPVALANDADCFALSEASDGAAAGARCVFGVILGTGVGGGIVVRGRLLDGPNRIAGEWGHNPLPWPEPNELPGPPCYCGRSGCIESFLSGPGLARDYESAAGQCLEAREIVRRATENRDEACAARLRVYEHRLAKSLASVINLLDPDVIVLGGGLSNIPTLYENVPRLWGEFVFSDCVLTRLVRALHGDSSGVRGAAWLGSLRL